MDVATGNSVFFDIKEIERVVLTSNDTLQVVLRSKTLQPTPQQVVGSKRKTVSKDDIVFDGEGKPVGRKPSSVYVIQTIELVERPNVIELQGGQKDIFLDYLRANTIVSTELAIEVSAGSEVRYCDPETSEAPESI